MVALLLSSTGTTASREDPAARGFGPGRVGMPSSLREARAHWAAAAGMGRGIQTAGGRAALITHPASRRACT